MSYTVEVFHKPGVVDAAARELLEDVRLIGFKTVRQATTGQLYRISGTISAAEQKQAAERLLVDPIVQSYRNGEIGTVETSIKGSHVVIDVWYKSGVTDVIGESVLKGLHDLGLNQINEVRTGRRFRLWGVRKTTQAEAIADTLLSNPLIQDRTIHAS